MKEKHSETVFSERKSRFSFFVATTATVLFLTFGPAFARSSVNQKTYEIYMTAARKLYAAGQYREAIEQFEKAYDALPDPKIYFNLAQSHRMLNEADRALKYYEKFLAAIPGITEFSSRQKEDFTREIQRKIDELKAAPEAGLQSPVPDPAPGGAEPGNAPPVGQGHNPRLTSRWWFWSGAGVTALLAAGTIWAGLRTVSFNDQWEQNRLEEDHDRAVKYQNITDLFLIGTVAGVLAVTVSSVIWKRKNPARAGQTTSRVQLVPGSDARSWLLTLGWDF